MKKQYDGYLCYDNNDFDEVKKLYKLFENKFNFWVEDYHITPYIQREHEVERVLQNSKTGIVFISYKYNSDSNQDSDISKMQEIKKHVNPNFKTFIVLLSNSTEISANDLVDTNRSIIDLRSNLFSEIELNKLFSGILGETPIKTEKYFNKIYIKYLESIGYTNEYINEDIKKNQEEISTNIKKTMDNKNNY
jgi:hypothetical protein